MLSNQYPSILYTVNAGSLVPVASLSVNGAGQIIIVPFSSTGSTPSGVFVSSFNSSTDLKAVSTAGGATPLLTIIPVMNASALGKLDFYQLQSGAGGNFQPNDYNATTNNVSWFQVL